MKLPGMPGELLLVRLAVGSSGVTDALYRVRGTRLDRLHVPGLAGDGVTTALVGRTYVDLDCGPRLRTLEEVALAPTGSGWRVTEFRLTLRGDRFSPTGVRRRPSVAASDVRRCPIRRW